MSLLGFNTEVLSINKHWSVGSRWMDEFILAASKGVWDPHNNSALKGHLRSRKSFGWRHTSLFFSYSSEHVSTILVSVKCRGETAREKRKRLIAWFPQGAFCYLNVFFLCNGSESCPVSSPPPPKPNKYGEFGRKFPLSHACVGPHRGHRLTEQEYDSSYLRN